MIAATPVDECCPKCVQGICPKINPPTKMPKPTPKPTMKQKPLCGMSLLINIY